MIEPLWIGIVGIFLLLFLLFSGVYVAVALGLVGVLGMIMIIGFEPAMSLLATTCFHYGTTYAFIVIPLFVAMGLLSAETGVSKDSYDSLTKWVGHIRGGLAIATVGACTIFGALTGSSIVTSVVFAKVSVPEMMRHGYDAKISYGLVSAAGAIGMMIPPSLLAVIYALITEQSIGQLLMAGVGPGIVLSICLALGFIGILTLRPFLGPSSRGSSVTWNQRFIALPKLLPGFIIATIVIGGIYAGVFTVTEAAGIGTFVLLAFFFATKRFSRESWQLLLACLRETVSLSAMVLLILATAQVFARLLVLSGLGPLLADFIINMHLSVTGFIIAATALYFVLGTLLDSISIIAITIPLFYPIVQVMGIDSVWFAMIMILATQIGLITPPVGLIVYAVKGVADPKVSLEDIFRGVLPFFFLMTLALAIVIAFPTISTWIPYHMWQP